MRNSRSTCTSEGDFIFYSSVIFHAASLQRSDFPFQLSVFRFEFTNGCFICANLTFCGSKPSIESSISIRTSRFLRRDLCLKLRLCVCNRCIAIRNFLRNGIIDCLISIGDFSVDGRVDSRIAIVFFLRNSGSNCSISRIFFIHDFAINFGLIIDIHRLRIVCEFRIYVSTCFRNSVSYSSIDISLIRLAVKRCFDCRFIHFVIHSIFKIIQRVFCSECGISNLFIQFLGIQLGDVFFIRSDVRCILNNLGRIGFVAKCCFIRFVVQQCIHSRLGIYLSGASRRLIHMHDIYRTRYAQSPAEERQRKERGESRTAHGLPARTLRMRLRDFRRYHIAILCFRPDDFVDVVHDDFPLCEKQ